MTKPRYVPAIYPALASSPIKRRRLAKVRLMRADRAIAKRETKTPQKPPESITNPKLAAFAMAREVVSYPDRYTAQALAWAYKTLDDKP
jgi:hypothetical protein